MFNVKDLRARLANEAQREEWVKLFAIDEITGDLMRLGYRNKLKLEFQKAHPTLVGDMRHFKGGVTARSWRCLTRINAPLDPPDATSGRLHRFSR